jgi:tetratricopeptide (TPR) repeat protein
MSKRKKRREPTVSRPSRQVFSPDNPNTPRHFAQRMAEVDQLVQKKRWQEALAILIPLDRRYPGQPDLLAELANAYYELGDISSYQDAVLRLLKVDPDNADAMYGLAGSYMATMRPVLALKTLRQCLQRWPDHEKCQPVQ